MLTYTSLEKDKIIYEIVCEVLYYRRHIES